MSRQRGFQCNGQHPTTLKHLWQLYPSARFTYHDQIQKNTDMGSAKTCKTFVKRPTALWLIGVACKTAADYEDYTEECM